MKLAASARTLPARRLTLAYPKSSAQILDDFDALVVRACTRDKPAVGALAMAVGPMLLRETHDELGPDFDQDAGDVLHDFFAALLEGRCRFLPAHGRARPWLCRIVRVFARAHRDAHERAWGVEETS